MTTLYGIKNCDTMKKAFNWLDENNIAVSFHDYKKEGAPEPILKQALAEHGWENVLNRRGTTWRKLSDETKTAMDEESALQTALESPSIIKRPLLVHNGKTYLGFKDDLYRNVLG